MLRCELWRRQNKSFLFQIGGGCQCLFCVGGNESSYFVLVTVITWRFCSHELTAVKTTINTSLAIVHEGNPVCWTPNPVRLRFPEGLCTWFLGHIIWPTAQSC